MTQSHSFKYYLNTDDSRTSFLNFSLIPPREPRQSCSAWMSSKESQIQHIQSLTPENPLPHLLLSEVPVSQLMATLFFSCSGQRPSNNPWLFFLPHAAHPIHQKILLALFQLYHKTLTTPTAVTEV